MSLEKVHLPKTKEARGLSGLPTNSSSPGIVSIWNLRPGSACAATDARRNVSRRGEWWMVFLKAGCLAALGRRVENCSAGEGHFDFMMVRAEMAGYWRR